MMKESFVLKRIAISKMPGFPRGMKALDSLAKNINIITGPNASGKSSTARVIRKLIWNKDTHGLTADASVLIDNTQWGIKIDSDQIIVQRDGNKDRISGIPAIEAQHRYGLSLHNLITAEEKDLAAEIVKESIGGYDLEDAKTNLNYSEIIRNRASSQYKDVIYAEKVYGEIREEQRGLEGEQNRLASLYEDKKQAEYAQKQHQLYEQYASYLQTKLEYEQFDIQLKTYPDSIEKISGEENLTIDELEEEIRRVEVSVEEAKENIKRREEILQKLSIPEEGVSTGILTEIENRISKLKELENNIQNLKSQIESSKVKELGALKAFDTKVDPTAWEALKLESISGLDKMLQDALQVLGEKEFLLAEIRVLESRVNSEEKQAGNSEILLQGIRTLGNWLKEQNTSTGLPLWSILILSLLGILTSILTYFLGWVGLMGLALIVVVSVILYWKYSASRKNTSVQVRKQDFINSGLTPPATWDVDNTASRIEELIDSLKHIKESEALDQKLKSYKEELIKLKEREDRLNQLREEWIDKLQAVPGFSEVNSSDFSSLYWFLKRVESWQNAHIQSNSYKAEYIEFEKSLDEELEKCNLLFEKSNFDRAEDHSSAKGIFEDFREENSLRIEELRKIDADKNRIQEQSKQKQLADNRLQKIYQNLNLEFGEKEGIRLLVNQLPEYKSLTKDHYVLQQGLGERKAIIQNHSLYLHEKEKLALLSLDQITQELIDLKLKADKLESHNEEIIRIETRIESKKAGHELEDALGKKEEALNKLEELYEENLSSITGNLLVEQLKKQTQEQNRPEVFKRANEIFNRITNSRYELRITDRGPASFQAYDTVLRLGQSLSELSTGTRVQLLLSVRLAYVETLESNIKIPILADELLANSDDERAQAIIRALIEISKDGRQVFYFTAQQDEVGKWISFLKEEVDLEYKIIQLATVDSVGSTPAKTDFSEFIFNKTIPSPDGETHKSYAEKIEVPSFDISNQNSSQLSLWYLLDDVNILYDCLKRGLRFWGQLESFLKNNGQIERLTSNIEAEIQDKITLLDRFQDLYQRGRSRKIDREVLHKSGEVSASFLDAVSDKLEELNGNPKDLIEVLRNGEVARFRANNTDNLEEYLLNEGYISSEEILSSDEVNLQLQAIISQKNMDFNMANSFIQTVISS